VFRYLLRLADGEPVDPPQFLSSEPNWRVGDAVRIGADVRFTITGLSYDEATDVTTWIVMPGQIGERASVVASSSGNTP
jgi:hypothetical protein